MIEIIKNIDNQIIVFYFFFILLPFLVGWAVIFTAIWTWYWGMLWKGMDEDKSIVYFKYRRNLNEKLLKRKEESTYSVEKEKLVKILNYRLQLSQMEQNENR